MRARSSDDELPPSPQESAGRLPIGGSDGSTDRPRPVGPNRRTDIDREDVALDPVYAVESMREMGIRTWRRGPRARARGDLSVLSDREREIAKLVASGASTPDTARTLFLARKTVERHVSIILERLGVKNRAQLAARMAAGHGRVLEE